MLQTTQLSHQVDEDEEAQVGEGVVQEEEEEDITLQRKK
jgi:hypothetical protein